MKIYELTNTLADGTEAFKDPLKVLDQGIIDILSNATMLAHEADAEISCALAAKTVGLKPHDMMLFLLGFDLGLQYMELVRRRDDLGEFEKSLGIIKDNTENDQD